MSAADDHVLRIRQCKSHKALSTMWQRVLAGEPIPDWPPGKAMEYLILRAFELEKAEVQYSFEVQLQDQTGEQIDGAVFADGFSCLVEVKDHAKAIDAEPIHKLRSQVQRRPPATMGLLFSRGGFTAAAGILAEYLVPQQVLLWEATDVTLALERKKFREGLKRKFRFAVEQGFPDRRLSEEPI